MTNARLEDPRVTTEHRAKWAYVYVRQSSLSQVTHHGESTELQYQLVERAVQLGWPPDRVQLIDEDLGTSATSAAHRPGFQRLIAEIGLGRVGLVVSWDASRLARNNRDWYQLLELCTLFGTLLADGERLYDPRTYTDRLVLGLSGMMSEAELHQLKLRLQAGARHKAQRGELRQALPVGLERQRSGEVILHPDQEIQARLRLVFDQFDELGSAKAVVRYLHAHELPVPTRPLRGPEPHEVVWRPASSSSVLSILKNPAYAGTYVYGRSTREPTRRQPDRPCSGIVRRALDQWPIVVHNVYPAYLTWEVFLAHQAQLQANQNHYQEDKPGVPRKGQALLQGIVVCGRCGARMRLRYSGTHGEFPVYVCHYAHSQYGEPRCQEVRGLGLDTQVEQLVLAALAPDRVALALASLEHLEQENQALHQQWHLRLERARYEAERARRQYDTVEPENRLVARSLESQWEAHLRAVEKIEQEYQTWRQHNRLEVTAEDRHALLALGEDLPHLWHAATTTPADRKRIVRLVINEVIVDQHRQRGTVWFQLNWQTGATSQHEYKRRVNNYINHADGERLQQRVRQLHAESKMDAEIAAILHAEGFRTAQGQCFSNQIIWLLRKRWDLPTVKPNGSNPPRWEDGRYSVEGAATVLGVFPGTIYKWLRCGRLQGQQLAKGTPWKIRLTEEQIPALKAYVQQVRRSRKEVS